MRVRYIVALLIFAIIPLKAIANANSVIKAVKPSMVSVVSQLIDGRTVSGSGVIVAPEEILTNCHVISNAKSIVVSFSNGQKENAVIKGRVSTLDLCVLVAHTQNRPVVKIVPVSDIAVGQAVFAVGDPLSLNATISDGIVSAIRQIGVGKAIQFTAPISPGSSGGGLFDIKGRLLGISTFTYTKGQNLNFAIPAEYMHSLGVIDSAVEDKKTQKITFKGIPFGSSPKQFADAMPGSTCEETFMGYHCHGGKFAYLNTYSHSYSAFFKNSKFYSIIISFPIAESYDVTDDLIKTLSGHFGPPTTGVEQGSTQMTWEPNPLQSINLDRCPTIFCRKFDGARITITDRPLAQEKNNSDF